MKPNPSDLSPVRLLVVDDNPTIHEDIRRVLCPPETAADLLADEAAVFGHEAETGPRCARRFDLSSAFQGREALAHVTEALDSGRPFAVAFVDVRMPPGWDGIETIRQLWLRDPDLQVVICTAYSDHTWEGIVQQLDRADSFVILKKPFDNIELLQLAHALTRKWELNRQARLRMEELREMVERQTAELRQTNERLREQIRRREQTELALRGSEHRFELAFKASSVPMALLHAGSRTFLEVNESFQKLTARAAEDVVGHTTDELGCFGSPADWQRLLAELEKKGGVRDATLRVQRPDGDPRDTLVSLQPIVLGETRCLLAALQDVTEQRRLESQLRQSQKMEAIGQLAAGVAHDFNNLLTIIHGHASLQSQRRDLDEPARHSLAQIQLAADRASKLTRQLLAFSRKQVMQPRALCINDVIEKGEALLKRLLGETIQLECRCRPALPPVFADEHSLDNVVMNLAINARDAMPGGGRLEICTDLVELGEPDRARHPDARPGRFVTLSVKDNGCGMDTKILSRIFEPFFTTKPQGKGTGLGLSTVFGIVKQHEGWIEVQSLPGMGSTFTVFLPVTDKTVQAANDTSFIARTATTGTTSGGERILVVEDEPVLRDFVRTSLQAHGYEVLEAGDGLEALRVAAAHPDKIDLLLTDMVMPNGMTGTQLAEQLRRARPDLRVLFSSGYSEELVGSPGKLAPGINFLPKPFDVRKLLKTVRACLEAPPAM
ncbi:MAG: response regulator [Limisphaerales bacterium]